MKQSVIQKDYLYVYGFTYLEEWKKTQLPSLTGIDERPLVMLPFEDIVAITTSVSSEKFSQEHLDANMKKTEWLKAKAFHHHECISSLYPHVTILPIPFGTIYKSGKNLRNLICSQKQLFLKRLASIKGKQEWNVKLYCDQEKSLSFTLHNNPAILELKEKLKTMPAGRQFLFKKKLEQLLVTQSESLQSQWWNEIHEQLYPFVSESHLRQNWSREVTERKDDMIANCDYLIPQDKVESFIDHIKELEDKYKEFGCFLQISGPWPPYHFSKMDKENN
jgi:hypothetical protein